MFCVKSLIRTNFVTFFFQAKIFEQIGLKELNIFLHRPKNAQDRFLDGLAAVTGMNESDLFIYLLLFCKYFLLQFFVKYFFYTFR